MENKYYNQINEALLSYEEYKPHHDKTMDWICNRIDWCWHFKKISDNDLTELTNRVINIFKNKEENL